MRARRWTREAMAAARLARDLRYKSWLECARVIDRFILAEANHRLDQDTIDLIKARQPRDAEAARRIDRWAEECIAILRSVLVRLEAEAEGPLAGMLALAPMDPAQLSSIKERVGALGFDELENALQEQHGHALLILALMDSDHAATMLARDSLLA